MTTNLQWPYEMWTVKTCHPTRAQTFGPVAEVSVAGEGAGPGNVAMTGWVEVVFRFAEEPAIGFVTFSESKVIGGDVLLAAREAFFGSGKLVHESEAEVMLFAGEIYGSKLAAEILGGFPADLTSQAGRVARGLNVLQLTEEG